MRGCVYRAIDRVAAAGREELVDGPAVLVDGVALVEELVVLVAVLLLADLRDDQLGLELAHLLGRLLEAVLGVAVCEREATRRGLRNGPEGHGPQRG